MPTKKKRPRRKSEKPPPQRRRGPAKPKHSGTRRAPVIRTGASLQYKVVELSTVDEGALERTLNEWTAKGWNLDGVQFAMRESSKRPAMAFIFFTREGVAAAPDEDAARAKLLRLSESGPTSAGNAWTPGEGSHPPFHPLSAHERLARLAGLDEPEPPEEGLTLEPEE